MHTPELVMVTDRQAAHFWEIFVHRRAYLQQSQYPGHKSGKHYYFVPKRSGSKDPLPLTLSTLRQHLAGKITIAVYAVQPGTQTCKWIAIDADHLNAVADLDRLRDGFAADGIASYQEASRRGGHLWIFLEEPTPASLCRLYVLHKAKALGVAVKTHGNTDGIEVFPKQDRVEPGEFGNAIRLPCGIHRGCMQRFWFTGAGPTIEEQIDFLLRAQRVPKVHLERLTAGIKSLETEVSSYRPAIATSGHTVVVRLENARKSGKNYLASCPVCDRGRERHLSVNRNKPTLYRCWHNCSADEIKRALGLPPSTRLEFAI